jgi:hypothetical protein
MAYLTGDGCMDTHGNAAGSRSTAGLQPLLEMRPTRLLLGDAVVSTRAQGLTELAEP